MKRSGTVTILGAGASKDAGYPLASEFLKPFRKAVEEASQKNLEIRKKAVDYLLQHRVKPENIPKKGLTILEWFKIAWEKYEKTYSDLRPLAVPKLHPDGRPNMSSQDIRDTPTGFPAFTHYASYIEDKPLFPAYLESFFTFYDDYMKPSLYREDAELGRLREIQWRFRKLRDLAMMTAYRELSAYDRSTAEYLRILLELPGPEKHGCAIATLNHDLTIEQLVSQSNLSLYDGFAISLDKMSQPPVGWNEIENLKKRWEAVSEIGYKFVGFNKAPEDAKLLVKLHGSLGWYVIEEGSGEIGYRDDLRYNLPYTYFRLPYEIFWNPKMKNIIDELALGGPNDPITRLKNEVLTRKAGNVYIRPYLIFARALKSHPDLLYLDLTSTFTRLLNIASTILVIGYSWGDPHVNDLILEAVAKGAILVNMSKSAPQKTALALWRHKFPTTYHLLSERLFMFGGGAKRVLEDGNIKLPSGDLRQIDFIESIKQGFPVELSLKDIC